MRGTWNFTLIFTFTGNYNFTVSAPSAPSIIPEECSAENNSVTIAWQQPRTSFVEGYVLELDDGNGGEFRVSNNNDGTLHLLILVVN